MLGRNGYDGDGNGEEQGGSIAKCRLLVVISVSVGLAVEEQGILGGDS